MFFLVCFAIDNLYLQVQITDTKFLQLSNFLAGNLPRLVITANPLDVSVVGTMCTIFVSLSTKTMIALYPLAVIGSHVIMSTVTLVHLPFGTGNGFRAPKGFWLECLVL
jgi:hypothetical protein